ncbi:MAG TPA: SPOR domain-containing protein [Xanthobacteraceae bacterium]
MSMADDHTLESYRSNDPYRRASEPARPNEQAGGGDPLAELARLIGRSDPFAEFGRVSSRQARRQAVGQAQAALPAPAEQWHAPVGEHETEFASDDASTRDPDGTSGVNDPGYGYAPAHGDEEGVADNRVYDEVPLAADHQGRYEDDHLHEGEQYAEQLQEGYDGDQYYQDDAPLAPHEDEMYDDPPREGRRGSLVTMLALVGCALLGTAGAYAYRSYSAPADTTQPPPVITADNSTPTKIVPATAGDPQSGKAVQDRLANAGKEQLVSQQEEPVALKELASQPAPRVVPPAAPAQTGSAQQPPLAAGAAQASTEPKKIRTVTIRPDGTDMSGRPVGAPGLAAPPAPKAGTARSEGPISLDPQAGEPAAAVAGRTQTAAVSPPSARPAAPASGGFVVQLSSQRSESEALASFRSLQAKFPNELGGRQPIIRRADLGSKGVFYRTVVGPFASAHEASQFCASYKAAGGQCVVPNN